MLCPKWDFRTHGLQHLREIYLANNGLTQLIGGLFANLPALEELHLQVNPDLRYIANDVFSPVCKPP